MAETFQSSQDDCRIKTDHQLFEEYEQEKRKLALSEGEIQAYVEGISGPVTEDQKPFSLVIDELKRRRII